MFPEKIVLFIFDDLFQMLDSDQPTSKVLSLETTWPKFKQNPTLT